MLGSQFLYLRCFTRLLLRYLSSPRQYDISFVCLASHMWEDAFIHLKFRRYISLFRAWPATGWLSSFQHSGHQKGNLMDLHVSRLLHHSCLKKKKKGILCGGSFEFHDKLLVINSELLKLSPDFIFAKNSRGVLLYQVIQI